MTYPHLDDVVKAEDVETKGGGKFAANYVNWARIARYLREHAPGWQPYAQPNADGGLSHAAPNGTFYMLIGFRHPDPEIVDTELVPHAIMDHQMRAKTNPDARDVADSYVRGMCKAAALLFGLGWQLWSKDDPLSRDEEPPAARVEPKHVEAWDSREHAEQALTLCTTNDHLRRWADKTRASKFQGLDRDELLEAYQERTAILNEAAQPEEQTQDG
jgi:hypothetical protein